jgi:hypothetical protein
MRFQRRKRRTCMICTLSTVHTSSTSKRRLSQGACKHRRQQGKCPLIGLLFQCNRPVQLCQRQVGAEARVSQHVEMVIFCFYLLEGLKTRFSCELKQKGGRYISLSHGTLFRPKFKFKSLILGQIQIAAVSARNGNGPSYRLREMTSTEQFWSS